MRCHSSRQNQPTRRVDNEPALTPAPVVPLPRRKPPTPEELATRAMANQPTGASGKKLKLTMTIYLTREQAEKLTARAIRSNRNLAALCSEILEADRG
jgi:hypothetical protein